MESPIQNDIKVNDVHRDDEARTATAIVDHDTAMGIKKGDRVRLIIGRATNTIGLAASMRGKPATGYEMVVSYLDEGSVDFYDQKYSEEQQSLWPL